MERAVTPRPPHHGAPRVERAHRPGPAVLRAVGGSAAGSHLVVFFVVLVLYAAGSDLSNRLVATSGMSAVFFIPAGITLAFLVRLPRRYWPAVLAGTALAEFAVDLLHGLDVRATLGFVVANTAEPLVGALLVLRWCGDLDLRRRDHLVGFLVAAVLIAPMVGAVIGATSVGLWDDDAFETLWQWWLGDAVAVLVVGGAALSVGTGPENRSLRSGWGALLVAGSVLLAFGVHALTDMPLLFLVLLGVVVAGAQFGTRAVTVTSLAITFTVGVWLLFEEGQLVRGLTDDQALTVLMLQLGLFTVAGLMVAAEAYERELAVRAAVWLQAEAAEEHRIVERLQRLLLPPATMVGDGHTAIGIYRPASSGLGVGGDWYDVFTLPDGHVVVSVGDVVGSGPDAAAVMSRLRVALSVLAPTASHPGELLGALDDYARRLPAARCTTVWAGFYDPFSGTLTYSSAGHPPGLVVHEGRVVRLDDAVSMPLGVVPGRRRPSSSLVVQAGDTLVVYTDGLVERRGETLDVGIARLEAELARAPGAGLTPMELVDRLADDTHHDDTVVLWVSLERSEAAARPAGEGDGPTTTTTTTTAAPGRGER